MKFHSKTLISYIPCPLMSSCPLCANKAFEGLIRLSIHCQLCSFSANYGHLGQVIYVAKLICIRSALQSVRQKQRSLWGLNWLHTFISEKKKKLK